MPSPRSVRLVLDVVSVENDVASQDEHVVFMASIVWKSPADERPKETIMVDVVWDDQLEQYHGSVAYCSYYHVVESIQM